jgi:hypothetical protein
MAAVVTDQFRISNASNFVESVLDSNNSYYVFLGLSNPGSTGVPVGFGRSETWDASPSNPPNPTDNLQYLSHYRNTALFGKKVGSANVRRVVRKVDWVANTRYDMYRHDYSEYNLSPNANSARLYDSNYYVVNSDYRVYICLYNGSYGKSTDAVNNYLGDTSKDEPTFTDLEPSRAGTDDNYIWKYLFTISPSDIIKFDSTEYIVLPNDWSSSTDYQIQSVRESGDSTINSNQIKIVYIDDQGGSYVDGTNTYNIIGDGEGAKVSVTISGGKIISTKVVSGGSGYTYGIVDLQSSGSVPNPAKLIPIIPPSKGHGHDIYNELGSDKVLIYARFDDSTRDFPVDAKFCQVGVIKNPLAKDSNSVYSDNEYSSLSALKISLTSGTPKIGEILEQEVDGGTAKGYVASYDSETGVLKYYRDRSLYFANTFDQTDRNDVSTKGNILDFANAQVSSNSISHTNFEGSIVDFTGSSVTVGSKLINLGVYFDKGIAESEINKNTGDIIYIDNRSLVERDSRQKEDVKIILEF